MTRHLAPEEFVDLVEGTLDAARAAHLDSCTACRTEAADMGAMLDVTRQATDTSTPSPLFWPHFAARVRAATWQAAGESGAGWWRVGVQWRFAAAAAVVVAVTFAAVWMTRMPAVSVPDAAATLTQTPDVLLPLSPPADGRGGVDVDVDVPAIAATAAAEPGETAIASNGDAAWQRVVALAGALPADETLVGSSPPTGGAMRIDELSQPQLREFMRLLRAEAGGQQ